MRNCTFSPLLIASVLLSSPVFAEVEADCYEGAAAKTCRPDRLGELRLADIVMGKALRRAGWDGRSFGVQYLASSDGGPDTLLFTLRGPKTRRVSKTDASNEVASAEEMALIAEEMRWRLDELGDFNKARLLRFVSEVQIDNRQGLVHTVLKVPCYEGVCSTYRKADAEDAARFLAPVLEKAGWRPSLFSVQYVADPDVDRADASEAAEDELVIDLRCARGGQRPTFAGASSEDVDFAAKTIKKFLYEAPPSAKERLLRGVDRIRVGSNSFSASEVNPSPAFLALPPEERKRLQDEARAKALEILAQSPLFGGKSDSPAESAPEKPAKAEEREGAQVAFEDCRIETSAAMAERLIARRRLPIRICYDNSFPRHETQPAGEVTVTFVIDLDGNVQTPRARGDSAVLDDKLSECILSRVRSWTFPAGKKADPVSVTYRFPMSERL
ncbi:MAG TPA: hypothetical protein DFS52_16525 [Myxococcales bacterium]|jgi:hypothetical protein|nr:hypothetical protein [Myxococcales bacterium]